LRRKVFTSGARSRPSRRPSSGGACSDAIVAWRKNNGGFKRTADLRRVKGFGYKTFKKLEPFLDIKGGTTLAAGSGDP
jgi:type II secretory pathway component PulK